MNLMTTEAWSERDIAVQDTVNTLDFYGSIPEAHKLISKEQRYRGLQAVMDVVRPEVDLAHFATGEPERFYTELGNSQDTEEKPDPYASRSLLHCAAIGTLAGDRDALTYMGYSMLVGTPELKTSVSYFLGNLTNEQVGSTKPEVPSKEAIIDWAKKIASGQIRLENRLEQFIPESLPSF